MPLMPFQCAADKNRHTAQSRRWELFTYIFRKPSSSALFVFSRRGRLSIGQACATWVVLDLVNQRLAWGKNALSCKQAESQGVHCVGVQRVCRDRRGEMRKMGRRSSRSQPRTAGIKFTPHEQGRAKSCYILWSRDQEGKEERVKEKEGERVHQRTGNKMDKRCNEPEVPNKEGGGETGRRRGGGDTLLCGSHCQHFLALRLHLQPQTESACRRLARKEG